MRPTLYRLSLDGVATGVSRISLRIVPTKSPAVSRVSVTFSRFASVSAISPLWRFRFLLFSSASDPSGVAAASRFCLRFDFSIRARQSRVFD